MEVPMIRDYVSSWDFVFKNIPTLTHYGIGIDHGMRRLLRRTNADIRERLKAEYDVIADEQASLRQTDPEHMGRITRWCGMWGKRKTINRNHNSYSLKHDCEKAIGRYVSNGQLIAAMVFAGFKHEPLAGYSGVAVCFNVRFVLGCIQEDRVRDWKPEKGDSQTLATVTPMTLA
jgi:hypothetical protein